MKGKQRFIEQRSSSIMMKFILYIRPSAEARYVKNGPSTQFPEKSRN